MSIEDDEDLGYLREAGRVVRRCLARMKAAVRPGISTAALDAIALEVMDQAGARPAPALVYGFPGATCISVNDEVVHGVPSSRRLEGGDLVKLDVTIEKDGYMADAAITVGVGPMPRAHRALVECAHRAFRAGLEQARAGRRLNDVGRAIERVVRGAGFSVVDGLSGHGIGRTIHEPPTVPNVDDPEATARLTAGLVITIEPLITTGSGAAYEAEDRWTVRTRDGHVAAHYEHTLVVTEGAPILLTAA